MNNPNKMVQSTAIAGVVVALVLPLNTQASETLATTSEKPQTALEKPKMEGKFAEWHLENWPSDESHRQYYQTILQTKNGKHIWRNSKGHVVAEIEIKESQPFEGIAYIQGASDYRMVTRWEKGGVTILYSYGLKDGKWEISLDNQQGVQGAAGQPAATPHAGD